jgi:hypothetical protein
LNTRCISSAVILADPHDLVTINQLHITVFDTIMDHFPKWPAPFSPTQSQHGVHHQLFSNSQKMALPRAMRLEPPGIIDGPEVPLSPPETPVPI